MARKKFTMDDYYAQMEEIRERHKVKPAAPANLMERLRQVVRQRLPKLPPLRLPTEFGDRKAWYSAERLPEPTQLPRRVRVGEVSPEEKAQAETWRLDTLQNRLVEIRKKSKYSLSVLSPYELEEIDWIEKELRKAGITFIGKPSPLRKYP